MRGRVMVGLKILSIRKWHSYEVQGGGMFVLKKN